MEATNRIYRPHDLWRDIGTPVTTSEVLIGLELWGEAGEIYLDPSTIVHIQDLAAVPPNKLLNMEFIGPRVKIVTRADQIILVEGSAKEVVDKIGAARAETIAPKQPTQLA